MTNRQDTRNRLAIIAGGGQLPHHVAAAAAAAGEKPFVIALENEADDDWSGFDHVRLGAGNFARLRALFKDKTIDRVVMSGSVSKRPDISDLRPTWRTFAKLPSILKKIASGGDNSVLTMVIDLIEAENVRVVAVQDIVPGLIARPGPVGQISPTKQDLQSIEAAMQAAVMLGKLDIGQGAVAVGGRVVALEGPEGTDAMLNRVKELRQAGRISASRKGVLVKLCKPQQDLRVDLPSIGLSTLKNAKAAGLAGIALEAGRSIVMEEQAIRQFADDEGLFVTGLELDAFLTGHAP